MFIKICFSDLFCFFWSWSILFFLILISYAIKQRRREDLLQFFVCHWSFVGRSLSRTILRFSKTCIWRWHLVGRVFSDSRCSSMTPYARSNPSLRWCSSLVYLVGVPPFLICAGWEHFKQWGSCHLDLFLVGGKFKILLMVEDATGRRKRITDLAIEMEVGFRVMINRLVVCLSFVLGSILESDPSTCPAEMYR